MKDRKVIGQEVLANPFTQVEHGKGILVAEFLIRHSVDVVVTKESFTGKGPYYVFSSAAVEYFQTREDTPEKALAQLGIDYP